jgi:two-component system capsular synthesis response regulator RcsB
MAVKMNNPIRVLAADDHPIVLFALAQTLAPFKQIQLVATALDSGSLVDQLQGRPVDVLVIDFCMPCGRYGDGLALLEFLRQGYPQLPMVLLTMIGNPALLGAALQMEVGGVVIKTDDLTHVAPAIFAAFSGKRYLSPTAAEALIIARTRARGNGKLACLSRREAEVLRLYASGQAVSEIAALFDRSAKTISAQKKTAMRKLGLVNDMDLFEYAQSSGFSGLPGQYG